GEDPRDPRRDRRRSLELRHADVRPIADGALSSRADHLRRGARAVVEPRRLRTQGARRRLDERPALGRLRARPRRRRDRGARAAEDRRFLRKKKPPLPAAKLDRDQAMDEASRLPARRSRSEAEIAIELTERGASPTVVGRVLGRLRSLGYIDDE